MKGVKYTAREKQRALKMWLEEKEDIFKVTKKFHCTERSLWRWKAAYNGTLESLENKTSRPHTAHPKAHTDAERDYIEGFFKENPNISYSEALGELRQKHGYSRTYFGFYRFVVKNHIREEKEERNPYVPKPYNTPEFFGLKMQMDVKYVPRQCNKGEFPDEWYYQYTMIDEATRQRFLYPCKEHSGYSTVDFIKRAIHHFGYIPRVIQTDNGTEFTNPRGTGEGKVHIVDQLCQKLKIEHKLIRVYTPRHNGKVERSHRSDQEAFYNHLTFTTYEELVEKMAEWNQRYNNRPHSSLRDLNGKRTWLSPLQKRELLMGLVIESNNEQHIRFLKKSA